MVGRFVEAHGGVSVKDGTAESRALDRIPIATRRAMAAGQDKLERTSARRTEQRHGVISQAARVLLDVVHDLVYEFRIVESAEYFIDHGLLVCRKKLGDLEGCDHPVGVHLGAQRVIERKGDLALLLR